MRAAFHRRAVVALALLATGCADHDSTPYEAYATRARELARTFMLVDTHIDVPYALQEGYYDISVASGKGDFDYPRAIAGGLDISFMSIYIPAEYEGKGAKALADALIDIVENIARRSPDKFGLAYSVADARRLFAEGKFGMALGMENGAPLEGNLDNLEYFHGRGIRYITLTHSKANHISDSSYDEERPWGGLSPFGERVVEAMNDLGVMIDVSHVSDEAFYRVVEISTAPVLATHSSARHFTPDWERNMSDDMIRALAGGGGVIQINFGSTFLTREARGWWEVYADARDAYLEAHGYDKEGAEAKAFEKSYRESNPFPYAPLEAVLDHIDHVRDLVGIDHVGLGSDFDGVGDSLPLGLKDVSQYPNLIAGLLARGYAAADIEKILSGNVLRVWSAVEARAAR